MADSGKYSDIQNDPALSSFGERTPDSVDLPRFSVSQLTTLRVPFDDDVLFRKQAGMTAIGLWRKKIEEFGEQEAIEAIRKSGLNVTTLSYAGGFTGSAGLQFREALDDGYEAVFTAAAVGARTLVVSPGSRGRYTARHERRLVTQAVRELSFVAEELGVQLALMPRNSRHAGRWTSLHSLEDAIALCDATGRSNVGVVYDTFYLAGGNDALQPDAELRMAAQCAARIFVLQLRDAPEIAGAEYAQCIPGTGILPLAGTVQCLFEHGFNGDIDIQVFSEEIWKQDPCGVLSSCGQSVSGLLKNSLIDAASSIGA